MRLKEVSLQGYKSFAGKARFAFPPGITAIVGPNGSGKSNIADAIRWALGEQRGTNLRTKRQEDLIFAGSDRRARIGLADVSLTFENPDRWLAIDFSEVAVSRRIHRDGTSGYAVNGATVRLRDLLDLLGSRLGQSTYTVIGQGLVDSALTLRPEDRRQLIDEAAGIVPLQRRRDRALRQLAETDENLTRVRDIQDELGPRLKRMARLAERAAQYQHIATGLATELGTWYGYQWQRARDQLTATRAHWADRRHEVRAAEAQVAAAAEALRRAQQAAEAAEAVGEAQRATRAALAAAAAEARQAAAVARARSEALGARQLELSAGGAMQQAELESLAARWRRFAEEVDGLATESRMRAEAVAGAQSALAAAEADHERQAGALEELRQAEFAARSELGRSQDRLASLERTVAAKRAEAEAARAAVAAVAAQLDPIGTALQAQELVWAEADGVLAGVVAQITAAEAGLTETAAALGRARDAHSAARLAQEALRARADTLEALFGELDEARPRVERLIRHGRIEVVGTVSQLLAVTPGWEAAVAAALGTQVHGIVLRRAGDVDLGLELLSADLRGQVTLVPLRPPVAATQLPGAIRADLAKIVTAPSAPNLVDVLFHGTAFAVDLEAARAVVGGVDGAAGAGASGDGSARAAGDVNSSTSGNGSAGAAGESAWTRVATRDGRLLLASGIVVAGAPAQAVLELEQERRALPDEVAAAAARGDVCAAEVDRLAAERRTLESRLGDLADGRAAAERARDRAAAARASAQAAYDRLARESAWNDEAAARSAAEAQSLAEEIAALATLCAGLVDRVADAGRTVAAAVAERESMDLAGPRAALADAAAAAAEAAQRLAGRKAMLEAAERDQKALATRMAEEHTRSRRTAAEAAERQAEAERLTGEADALEAKLAELDAHNAPDAGAPFSSRAGLRLQSEALEAQRRQLRSVELSATEAQVTVSRAENRIERLYDQLLADAEWLPMAADLPRQLVLAPTEPTDSDTLNLAPTETTDPAATDSKPSAQAADMDPLDMAPTEPSVSDPLDLPLPVVAELPEDLERRIAILRREMRAVGGIDHEALAAYEETADRFGHLTSQRGDLEAAERDLRGLLETLEAEMAVQFEATFGQVAAAFSGFFPQLFGGGEAQLVAEKNEEGVLGIDILARPPGKRRQPLALLSGGERALTAVALIFALVQVSQTPFVVLDEVDAALDEANVGRFCEALQSLAEQTQVVIITHNRATVQTATTVYGISMGEDGASQIISLRVEDAAAA